MHGLKGTHAAMEGRLVGVHPLFVAHPRALAKAPVGTPPKTDTRVAQIAAKLTMARNTYYNGTV